MENNFGSALMSTFIDAAFPMQKAVELELISWTDITTLFFDMAPTIKGVADEFGEPWRLSSIALLDSFLRDLAERGQWEGALTVPSNCAVELWRRWQYVIIASKLEEDHGAPLNLPMPKPAPGGLKAWASVLYMVGGPGRDYDPQMFAGKP